MKNRLKLQTGLHEPDPHQDGNRFESSALGISIDELRQGGRILVPSPHALQHDPIVALVQQRVIELGFESTDEGVELVADGLFSAEFGEVISELRASLTECGITPGNFIDRELLEYLFPSPTAANVACGKIKVSIKNATLGEFPDLIREVQIFFNKRDPKAKILVNGLWSDGLAHRIENFQRENYLAVSGAIDAGTLGIIRKVPLEELVAAGLVTLLPSTEPTGKHNQLIESLQRSLNRHLGRSLIIDGIFSQKTAEALCLVQKALGVEGRMVFSKESNDKLVTVAKDIRELRRFSDRLKALLLIEEFLENLGDTAKVKALMCKMDWVSKISNTPEFAILEYLQELNINIRSPAGIAQFQRSRGILVDGKINKNSAEELFQVLTSHWYRKLILDHGYKWRDQVNELNAIGLRGWSLESGANDNQANLWNDTIAFVWRDARKRISCLEYTATTDPGLTQKRDFLEEKIHPDSEAEGILSVQETPCMNEGQYEYVAGFYNGRSGAAVPARQKKAGSQFLPKLLSNLFERIKTYFLGSHPFAIHWITGELDSNEVGQMSLGSQVPKITKKQFKKRDLATYQEGSFYL